MIETIMGLLIKAFRKGLELIFCIWAFLMPMFVLKDFVDNGWIRFGLVLAILFGFCNLLATFTDAPKAKESTQ